MKEKNTKKHSKPMFDLITVGDVTLDMFVGVDRARLTYGKKPHRPEYLSLPYAEKIAIDNLQYGVGGNAANVAVGVKTLGLKTAIATEIGADMSGEEVLSVLHKRGVDVSLVKVHKKQKTRYSIVLSHQGERTILSYFVKRNYRLPALPLTKWIYYTSLGPSFPILQSALISYMRKHPTVRLACNPGSYQLQEGLTQFRKILPFVSLLFVNKEEAETLVGKKMEKPQLLRALRKKGVENIVITDGIFGAMTLFEEVVLEMPVYPVKVVSKTGAGDAFASGFLSAIIRGMSVSEALCFGAANSAGVVQIFGAEEGLLNQKEVQKMCKKYPKIIPKSVST